MLAEVPDALHRARSMVGRGVYGLGKGGKDPGADDPFEGGRCDCSGFLAWCFRRWRKSGAGVWFYTDQLERDAAGEVKGDLGDGVAWDEAQLGDILVYGAGPKVGHCAIVSEVLPPVRDLITGPLRAIHCRAGTPPAVVETGVSLFARKGARVLRLR